MNALLHVIVFMACTMLIGEAGAASTTRDAYHEALAALKSGKPQTAVQLFNTAIGRFPGGYNLYNDRGVAYKRLGQIDKAIADYTKALDIKPDYVNALNNRGAAYVQTGDYARAIKDFTQALKFGSLQGKVNANLAIAFTLHGDYVSALQEFEKASALSALDAHALMAKGEALEKSGSKNAALDVYKQARSIGGEAALMAAAKEKIQDLEKAPASPITRKAAAPSQNSHAETGKRSIVPAPPFPKENISQPAQTAPAVAQIESLAGLEEASMKTAAPKFSAAAAEIFRQGKHFLANGDYTKAIVRFEDVQQLEKRNKNPLGMGYALLELSRTFTKNGDHAKAAVALEEAYKIFDKAKATNELIITLGQAAEAAKIQRQADRAHTLCTKASELAKAMGLAALAQGLEDLAVGKPSALKTMVAAQPSSPRQTKLQWGAQDARRRSIAPMKSESQSETSLQQRKADKTSTHAESELSKGAGDPNDVGSVPAKQRRVEAPEQTKPSASEESREPGQSHARLQSRRASEKAQGQGASVTPAPPAAPKRIVHVHMNNVQAPIGPPESAFTREEAFGEMRTASLPEVGKGPVTWTESARGSVAGRQKIAIAEAKIVAESAPDTSAAQTRGPKKDQEIFQVVKKAIASGLLNLRKLRQSNNERPMVGVLEQLADEYAKSREYEKAQHALSASLALRDKYEMYEGLAGLFRKSGFLKEQSGDVAGAIEDLSQASAIIRANSAVRTVSQSEAQVRTLAHAIGIDGQSLKTAFQDLWTARNEGNDQAEAEALYRIGKLYDQSKHPGEALRYYERSSASMTAERARIYTNLGKTDQARRLYDEALQSLKTLDYPRYLDLKKKGRWSQSVAAHDENAKKHTKQ